MTDNFQKNIQNWVTLDIKLKIYNNKLKLLEIIEIMTISLMLRKII